MISRVLTLFCTCVIERDTAILAVTWDSDKDMEWLMTPWRFTGSTISFHKLERARFALNQGIPGNPSWSSAPKWHLLFIGFFDTFLSISLTHRLCWLHTYLSQNSVLFYPINEHFAPPIKFNETFLFLIVKVAGFND